MCTIISACIMLLCIWIIISILFIILFSLF
nr:MAG TPA: hypothetical protein [Caudoviricetes sp.]